MFPVRLSSILKVRGLPDPSPEGNQILDVVPEGDKSGVIIIWGEGGEGERKGGVGEAPLGLLSGTVRAGSVCRVSFLVGAWPALLPSSASAKRLEFHS